jgi:integrase
MLYKRSKKTGAVYWTKFSIRGRKVQLSCGTNSKTLAEEFERQLREQIWRESALGEVAHTWEELKAEWLAEKHAKKSLQRDKDAFAAMDAKLAGLAIIDIDDAKCAEVEKHLRIGTRTELRSRSTVQRLMAVLRSTLKFAASKKLKWLAAAPTFDPVKQAKPATRWITQAQFETLWRELPLHAKQLVRFDVAMGLRSANLFRLRWDQVDLEANVIRIAGDELKSGTATGYPLAPEAREVLLQQRGVHPHYVFTDQRGRAPIGSIKTCWKKACIRAGVPGLQLRHMRHTFAAWHKLAGTPDSALQSLGGWSDPRMVQRYGQVAPTGFAGFADNRRSAGGDTVEKKPTKSGADGGKK